MTNSTNITAPTRGAGDVTLLELFEHWKVALGDETAAKSEHASNRAHARLRQLERPMLETAAEGLSGVAVKLALWRFMNEHSGADADLAEAAYRDVCRIVGRDFAAEAEAVVERRAA